MNRQEILAECILVTKSLFVRFLDGFGDDNRTRQAPGLPNHVIWCLGHCALTMHRIAERFDGGPLPTDDFVMGDGTAGSGTRFDTESVCFDSVPKDEPELYPTLERGLAIFEAATDRFVSAVRGAEDRKLDELTPWMGGEQSLWRFVVLACFHDGVHAGQVIDLRRALGLERVIKP
ncbi:MAG: DinB family protein [Planctomycetota bacterium]|jgi:hypothetical protein